VPGPFLLGAATFSLIRTSTDVSKRRMDWARITIPMSPMPLAAQSSADQGIGRGALLFRCFRARQDKAIGTRARQLHGRAGESQSRQGLTPTAAANAGPDQVQRTHERNEGA
jgi:hypothetical protein